ncbi:unnamed protein product [Polarella glacialis]|uniref:Uncharacterized protein n=1 Tax=Polarella glacialis TaxID=89957 RepID=A0A813DF33_POLGL|nr:unnamed protein product [Polarella glacialis]
MAWRGLLISFLVWICDCNHALAASSRAPEGDDSQDREAREKARIELQKEHQQFQEKFQKAREQMEKEFEKERKEQEEIQREVDAMRGKTDNGGSTPLILLGGLQGKNDNEGVKPLFLLVDEGYFVAVVPLMLLVADLMILVAALIAAASVFGACRAARSSDGLTLDDYVRII